MFAGGVEIVLILVLVAVFFGAGKLPDVMAAMGKGYREFDRAMTDGEQAPAPTATPPDDSPPREG